MDVDQFLRSPSSRRAFFRGAGVAFVAGAPVFIAACGGSGGGGATGTTSAAAADVEVLNSALDLEYTAVAAYRAALPRLTGAIAAHGRQFLGQEQEHAAALAQAIKQLGGMPSRPRRHYDIPSLASQTDALIFVDTLENTTVAAYIDALPKLSDPQLRGTTAAILTNEAEHVSVLLGALGKPQAPSAFVLGKQ